MKADWGSPLVKPQPGIMERKCGVDNKVSTAGENRAEGTSVDESCTRRALAIPCVEDKKTMNIGTPRGDELAPESLEVVDPAETGLLLPVSRKRKELGTGEEEARLIDNAEGSSRLNAESSSSNSSSHVILSAPHEEMMPLPLDLDGKSCKNFNLSHKASRSSSIDETSGEIVGFSSVDSVDPTKSSKFLKVSKEQIKFPIKQNSSDCSGTTQQKKTIPSSESGPALLRASKDDDNLPEQKPDGNGIVTSNQCPYVFAFDLNEELMAESEVCSQESNIESVYPYQITSVSEPVAVVAKVGVPVGLPSTPLQFAGELGWKRGGAATSAFRRAEIRSSDRRNKGTTTAENLWQQQQQQQPISCRGIDLNIAIAAADYMAKEPAVYLPIASKLPIKESSVKIVSKQRDKYTVDLNSKSECDENHRPKSGIHGFDLNDTYNEPWQMGQSGQLFMHNNIPSDARASSLNGTSRHSNYYDGPRPAYWVDLRAMPGFAQVQARGPFLMAAAAPGAFSPSQQMQPMVPLHPKLALPTPAAAAPGSIFTGIRNNGLQTAGYEYPPIIFPPLSGDHHHGGTVAPQISGSMLAAYPGSVYILDGGAQRLGGPSGFTNLRPGFILNSGLTSMENASRGANIKEFLIPGKNTSTSIDERVKSVQQVALPPTSMKRQEGAGWDSYPVTIDGRPQWS
ncbi:hypothetical protein Dimus_025430 [Dionaea muscipula]